MVSYRSSRKLNSSIVRVKLYPIDRIVGSKKKKKKRCKVYVNICETDTFSSEAIEETFKINITLIATISA